MNDVALSYADQTKPGVRRGLVKLIECTTGQRKLKRLYLDHCTRPTGESFWQSAVRRLGLHVRFDAAALSAIPATGPVVVVANHPYGVLDGIVIGWLVERVRSDFRILTNAVLLKVPDARDYLLPVDFSPGAEALKTNLQSRASARRHLEQGGVLVVFPAGGISTAPDRLGRGPAIDAPWQPFTAQLIQRSKATVVPIFFEGQNSRLFQIASHLSLTLRLSLIFREVKNRMGTELRVAIGAPIMPATMASTSDRQTLVDLLRQRTYALRETLPNEEQDTTAALRMRRAVSTRLARFKDGRVFRPRHPAWAKRLPRFAQPRPR